MSSGPCPFVTAHLQKLLAQLAARSESRSSAVMLRLSCQRPSVNEPSRHLQRQVPSCEKWTVTYEPPQFELPSLHFSQKT